MLVLGKDEKAKYPFLADAGRHLQEYGFELPQFGTDPALRAVVDKAHERVMAATGGSVYRSGLADGRAVQDRMLDVEILSFLIAIVLIKLANRHTLVRRFALSEARRAESYLAGDLSDRRDRSRADMARRILHDLFGLKVGVSDYRYLIPVPDYLKHSSVFHEREWKLVNRQVEDGHVILRPDKTVRLIRHALTTYISEKIRASPVPDTIPGLEGMVAELAAVADKLTPTYESTGENPPCIKHAINVLKSGENLPHSGRFMLATFLLARGRPVEEIAPLFKNAPDYSERVTMYQLNHLSGGTGGVKYNCPSCDKLRTQNLCFAVPECDGIITPLQFGRRRKAVRHEQQQQQQQQQPQQQQQQQPQQ
ncbi:MAG: hypothetical protein OXK17_03870, partial [Thaumarchaeota archaeon]|nr:hypothetical protein [Nitrososphaerota archaeon]